MKEVPIKIHTFEAHDRLLHFKKDQEANIFQGAEDCLKKNALSLKLQEKSPYIYLFAHPRTHDDGVTKVMFWQPRLTRPTPQTNSYLFRAKSGTDEIEVCWLLPPREMWPQYQTGNITEHQIVNWSIGEFTHNRQRLAKDLTDDLPEEYSKAIYQSVISEMRQEMQMKKLYPIVD